MQRPQTVIGFGVVAVESLCSYRRRFVLACVDTLKYCVSEPASLCLNKESFICELFHGRAIAFYHTISGTLLQHGIFKEPVMFHALRPMSLTDV